MLTVAAGMPPTQALRASEEQDFAEANWQQGALSAGQDDMLSVEVKLVLFSFVVVLLLQHPVE